MAEATTTWVALLRGINVGGKNKLPMKLLAELFAKAGATDVQTYIQSGNVVFRAPAKIAAALPAKLEKAIEKAVGFRSPVILRTHDELQRAARAHPFVKPGLEPKTLHIVFLADKPSAADGKKLDPNRSPPDQFVLDGREVYLYLPNGAAETKLSNAWFDSTLKTVSTGRNWNTIEKLLALSAPK